MEIRSNILYRFALFWGKLPPDTLGVVALFALEHHELVAGFISGCISALPPVAFFLLKYVGGLLVGEAVALYVVKMLAFHAWPKLPHIVQLMLLKMTDRALLRQPTRSSPSSRKGESAFSRNSKRHPHW